ncbi:MAG: hypothetical protein K8T10_19595 [Candidatus Eremiobacteraeota bacterium]|nr:hypothetical protein [Candidatus Eremiobacteraeota bacterium]
MNIKKTETGINREIYFKHGAETESPSQHPIRDAFKKGMSAMKLPRLDPKGIKQKWNTYKQFYNTDEAPDVVGIQAKKNLIKCRRQLACRSFNTIGSLKKGFAVKGRFLTFSSLNHWLCKFFRKIGLGIVGNMLDLETDEVKGGVNFQMKVKNKSGEVITTRNGIANNEGNFNLDVKLTDKEKKKVKGQDLRYDVFFRSVEDENSRQAYFNKHEESTHPVGAGNIHLVKPGETVISSDIDKTIMDTTIGPGYFYQEPWKRKFLPGAIPLYRALSEDVHTVSGSTTNLSTNILSAMESEGIEPRALEFKNWTKKRIGEGFRKRIKRISEQVGFKLKKQVGISSHLPPGVKTIAQGDITEYDPIFYLLFHGISSGDLSTERLEKMFSDKTTWPELARVHDTDKKQILQAVDEVPKGDGLEIICINAGSGKPDEPHLSNKHGLKLKDFITFADRLESLETGKAHYRDKIIFTDNYLQTAIYHYQNGHPKVDEKVILDVGKDIVSRGFTPAYVALTLNAVVSEKGKSAPRKFLDSMTLKKLWPALKKEGIVV